MNLTSRERIMRIFHNEDIDRPSMKLSATKVSNETRYMPIYEEINRLSLEKTDVYCSFGFPVDIRYGTEYKSFTEVTMVPTGDPNWVDRVSVMHTPKGDLRQVQRLSTVKEPSFILEHFIKEPEDIDTLLSIDYKPYTFDRTQYDEVNASLGDRGVPISHIPNIGNNLHTLMGSETLALFSVDCPEKLTDLADILFARNMAHVRSIMELGIKTPIGWVGPELYLPPLMGSDQFDAFITKYDKPVCDLIHNCGGSVWVHSHGKVANYLDRFIDMGVDVLNPLEPPPNGDVDFAAVVKQYGRQIGWEGNIEIQDILQGTKAHLADLIDACVAAGAPSGRFILCPSAGFLDYIHPSDQFIENLRFYLTYGREVIEKYRY